MAALDEQIKAEGEALKSTPVINPVVGFVERCHICGAVMQAGSGKVFDSHIPNRVKRKACKNCNAG